MNIVVFGLSISSAWGNGHATLLRGLFRSLHARGHRIRFFEKDVPYYASHRDAWQFPFVDLELYSDWHTDALPRAQAALANADAAIVTSYCPDGAAASRLIWNSDVERKLFYDMDTPATFAALDRGADVPYVPSEGLAAFDLVLSYTGGTALSELQTRLYAKRVAPLYGWVDTSIHHPVPPSPRFAADLSYLGTYAADRQDALSRFLLSPAEKLPSSRFVVGGAMYPDPQLWPANVRYYDHVPPGDHCEFYCSSRLTLNITRGIFAQRGFCPSGRLFEAAACGSALLSDWWEGLNEFFEPNTEILIATGSDDTAAALRLTDEEVQRIAKRAQERTLSCHTADVRAGRLLDLIADPQNATSSAAASSACAAA